MLVHKDLRIVRSRDMAVFCYRSRGVVDPVSPRTVSIPGTYSSHVSDRPMKRTVGPGAIPEDFLSLDGYQKFTVASRQFHGHFPGGVIC